MSESTSTSDGGFEFTLRAYTNRNYVNEFATQTNVWQVLDNWSTAGTGAPAGSKREILDGQFGFFLPGAEEIAISNFRYYPPAK